MVNRYRFKYIKQVFDQYGEGDFLSVTLSRFKQPSLKDIHRQRQVNNI